MTQAGLLSAYRRDIKRQAGLRQHDWDRVEEMKRERENSDYQIAELDDILGRYE